MIFSRIDVEGSDRAYPEAVRRALEFLRYRDVMAMALGRHEIDGDRMFANVMDMTTRGYEGSHPEIHWQYIDLMYWPEGGEKIGVASYLGTEKLLEAYPERDIAFVEDVEDESILVATAGHFGVFFPWDAHRPALHLGDGPATSRKVVIKIRMDLI